MLAAHGYTLDPDTGEVAQLAPYAGAFSARAAQITRNIDRYEAQWRSEHPGQEPGPKLRRTWDRRAWSEARPDKVAPVSGDELRRRWVEELHELGFTPPAPTERWSTARGSVRRSAESTGTRSSTSRSPGWAHAGRAGTPPTSAARSSGSSPRSTSSHPPPVRRELAEDLTARTVAGACRCWPVTTSPSTSAP